MGKPSIDFYSELIDRKELGMRTKRASQILLLVSVLVALSGCVRFIHGRRALNERTGFDPAAQYVGIEAFYRYEQEQRKRLEQLVIEREQILKDQTDPTYRVGAGDDLTVHVKKFEEISKDYTVSPAGTINVPFVGTLQVEGKTEQEISDYLQAELADFLVNPQVGVTVSNFSAHVVWVIGSGESRVESQANQYGAYPLKRRDYSLVDLLIEIGDPRMFSQGVVHLLPARSPILWKGPRGSIPSVVMVKRDRTSRSLSDTQIIE